MSNRCLIAFLSFAFGVSPSLAETIDPEAESEENAYYGNPFEPEESRSREAARPPEEPPTEVKELSLWNRIFASRIFENVFDTELPGLDPKGAWSFSSSPKFGDFIGDDYVRWPVGARYTFNTRLEGRFDLGIYTGNPFESGRGIGLYDIEPGFKVTFRKVQNSEVNVAVGLRTRIPIADPPTEVIDGYARYRPFVSLSRELTIDRGLLGYINFNYEIVEGTPFSARPIAPEPRDRLFIAPGLIYYPGKHFRYGFELEYRTNAISITNSAKRPEGYESSSSRPEILAFETIHELLASPSVTWFPSKKTRSGMRIPGNWDVGFRFKVPIIDKTGENLDLSVRFRWYYNYRRLIAPDLPQLFRRGVDDQE